MTRRAPPAAPPNRSRGNAVFLNQVADAAIRKYGPRRWWLYSPHAAKAQKFFERHPHCRDDSPEHRLSVAANPDVYETTTGATHQ